MIDDNNTMLRFYPPWNQSDPLGLYANDCDTYVLLPLRFSKRNRSTHSSVSDHQCLYIPASESSGLVSDFLEVASKHPEQATVRSSGGTAADGMLLDATACGGRYDDLCVYIFPEESSETQSMLSIGLASRDLADVDPAEVCICISNMKKIDLNMIRLARPFDYVSCNLLLYTLLPLSQFVARSGLPIQEYASWERDPLDLDSLRQFSQAKLDLQHIVRQCGHNEHRDSVDISAVAQHITNKLSIAGFRIGESVRLVISIFLAYDSRPDCIWRFTIDHAAVSAIIESRADVIIRIK